jgi:small subunit ribosomal protein S20
MSTLALVARWATGGPALIRTTTEVAVPRSASAKKHLRQTKTRTATNRAQRSQLRTAVKAARTAATLEERQAAIKVAERMLDRAGRKGIIHPNTAARTKTRLAKSSKK